MGESPLQMAGRHVLEQEARIVRQHALIERLDAAGRPTEDAVEFLGSMEQLLVTFAEDRDRLARSK